MIRIAACLIALGTAATAQEAVEVFGSDNSVNRLVVRSTTDIGVFGPVIEAFVEEYSELQVVYEQWGSNALFDISLDDCNEARFGADVVISSGVHQMVQLVNNACAHTYESILTQRVNPALQWRDELWGITREPAVIVYNRDLVPPADVPVTRFDLLDLLRQENTPYADKVATYDVEASGLGYLFAFSDSRQATTFGALMESLARADAVATCCSAEIINAVSDGTYLIAYNVLGSYAQSAALTDPNLGIVLPQDYTLILSRSLMIPKSVNNTPGAEALLDFLLSQTGVQALSRQLLISPLVSDVAGEAALPISESALRPIGLTPTLLVALDRQKREEFIRRWRETFDQIAE